MKKNYQDEVYYKGKESCNRNPRMNWRVFQNASFGIIVVAGIFLLGVTQFLWNFINASPNWRSAINNSFFAIIVVSIGWTVFMLMRIQKSKVAFAFDENFRGIWLSSFFGLKMIYIPLSMLRISVSSETLKIKYQKAFYFNVQNKVRIINGGSKKVTVSRLQKDQLEEFINRYNELTTNDNKVQLDEVEKDSLKLLSSLIGYIGIAGLALVVYTSPYFGNNNQDSVANFSLIGSNKSTKYVKFQDLKLNHTYSSKVIDFKVNKAYKAYTKKNKEVAIFNVTVNFKRNDISLCTDPFMESDTVNFIANRNNELEEDNSGEAQDPLTSTIIKVNGQTMPIINQLNMGENGYCLFGPKDSKSTNYNVVFNIEDTNKSNYFIYDAFGPYWKPEDKDSDFPMYVLKFNPNRLEEIK